MYDDGIESEGANRNVRIWGNYINFSTAKVAVAATTVGPIYIFRNISGQSVANKPFMEVENSRGVFVKFGGRDISITGGRMYVMHNTVLQPKQPAGLGINYPMGVGSGVDSSGGLIHCNIVSRNNIFQNAKDWHLALNIVEGCGKSDINNDLYYGKVPTLSTPVQTRGITGIATYAADVDLGLYQELRYDPPEPNDYPTPAQIPDAARPDPSLVLQVGPLYLPTKDPALVGNFQLASNSLGVGKAEKLPNVNDMYTSPDIGAHQRGQPNMQFGINAYR